MEQTPEQTPSIEQGTIVDTQYFYEVLGHFGEDGHLISSTTRFQIKCYICHNVHLSLVNPLFDKKSRATHEPFAVLPRCGHAFGYECISQWLMKDINLENPKCPTCRKGIFRSRIRPEVLHIFGTCEPEEQHLEIVAIRESLRRNDTPPLEPSTEVEPPRNPGWVILGNHEMMLLNEQEERRAFAILWGRDSSRRGWY
ncbi:hypothetical protein F4814DRAFT_452904 [Daldinia grandis]|nr:hypothetical protein F4814DRAFT_452904 [Daldinia grandis]